MTTPQPPAFTGNVHPVPGGPDSMNALFTAVWDAQPGDVILIPSNAYLCRQVDTWLSCLRKRDTVTVLPLAAVGERVV